MLVLVFYDAKLRKIFVTCSLRSIFVSSLLRLFSNYIKEKSTLPINVQCAFFFFELTSRRVDKEISSP